MAEQDRTSKTPPAARQGGPGGFGGGPRGMMPGEKPKNFKNAMAKIIRYLGAYRFTVAIVIVLSLGGTAFGIVGPKIMGDAVTELYNGLMAKMTDRGGIDFVKIGAILLLLLGIYLASALFTFIQGWTMSGVTQKVCFRMRQEISEKIHRMPMKYFESRTVGEVLSRITNDVDTLGQSLNQSVTQLISSLCTIIGVLVMMLLISPLMTLIALAIMPISMALIGVVVKSSSRHFKAQQEYLGKLNGHVEETISGHAVVKLFSHEGEALRDFDDINGKLFNSAWKSQAISGLMMPLMGFVGNLGYAGVAVAGGVLAFKGLILVGDIQAFVQYVRSFTQPVSQIAQISNMLQSMAAAAERVFEFLGEEEETQDADAAYEKNVKNIQNEKEAAAPAKVSGTIEFSHVHFGYTPDKIIINDFNCAVHSGQTVAIVGPTGAGKTTMVKLLMRFYDVNSGSISIDGRDIRSISRSSLREQIGMVLQDTWLFKGTIRDNICYGKLGAGEEEIIAAAKAADVHHFIQTLPGAYSMELNEDADNVSAGQKQLLTIARAILADKPVLILDEATSSVDTRTEAQIQNAMKTLMKGRTSFVIAHRLSTIRDANLILVMKDGDIVEQGTHRDLLAQNGFYADLYNSQFENAAIPK